MYTKSQINPLQQIQNSLARAVVSATKFTRTTHIGTVSDSIGWFEPHCVNTGSILSTYWAVLTPGQSPAAAQLSQCGTGSRQTSRQKPLRQNPRCDKNCSFMSHFLWTFLSAFRPVFIALTVSGFVVGFFFVGWGFVGERIVLHSTLWTAVKQQKQHDWQYKPLCMWNIPRQFRFLALEWQTLAPGNIIPCQHLAF